MRRFVFPYGIRFQEDGHIGIFPAAEIFVLGNGGKGIRTLFHIDSGATTTLLSASDAGALGIDIHSGKKILVRGISGEPLLGYTHVVRMQFNGIVLKVPVIFIERATVPRVLGREGIFSRFCIVFDEAKRRILFLENKKEQKIIDSLFR